MTRSNVSSQDRDILRPDLVRRDLAEKLAIARAHGSFILTALCAVSVSLSTACLYAADAVPFPPNTAHTNVTPFALAQAEQAPFATDPMRLVRGEGGWQNAGQDPAVRDRVSIARLPVNEAYPSWFVLVWPEPIPLSALRLRTNADQVKFYRFSGATDENPALAPDDRWTRVRAAPATRAGHAQNEWVHELALPDGTRARALKVRILEVQPRNSQIASISEFSVWGQPPSRPFEAIGEVPPVAIPCDYPTAGDTALVVEDSSGRRIRNLFAQTERTAGRRDEPWDLKDEDGNYVALGTYRARFTVGPKPELIYQMTPYPNVEAHSPHSTPWNRAPKDGWLSNHGNQNGVCVIGDRLYISAGGTEGGHALIETDLQGRKEWGFSSGFMGFNRLFTDGTTLFLQTGNSVRRLDPATRELKSVANLDRGAARKGTLVGLAARDNRIYAAYHAPLPRLDDATRGNVVDLDACLPKLPASVNRGDNYGIPLSPQRDFLSFFRLRGDFIAGDARNTLYLESTKGRGPRQHLVLAFREPVALGSLVFPRPMLAEEVEFSISALKADAPFPPDLSRTADWTIVKLPELAGWNCVPLPEQLRTRALRLTFSKPGAELLELLHDERDDRGPTLDLGVELDMGTRQLDAGLRGDEWGARIEGMRLLRARFENVAPAARVRVSSGTYNPETDEWDARRTAPLSEEDPGVFLLEWDRPQILSGLALKEVDGEVTKIDVFDGDGTPTLDGTNGWQTVAEYRQKRRNFYQPDAGNNADALYLDGTVDFGRDVETRAVRLRVVKQWGEKAGYPEGVRRDRGGRNIEPARCRIYGVAALRPLGGDVPVEPIIYQRLAVFDATNGTLLSEKPSAVTGGIEFRHQDGALFGFVGTVLMRIGEDDPAKPEEFIADLKQRAPFGAALTFDPAGNAYVWDHGVDRRQIRVYDENGTYLRSIGAPGPRQPGPYDPMVIDEACALAASGKGDLYAVYPHDNPRRVAHFRQDGAFVQDFFGNPNYGGGGTLDPYDKSRLYFADLRFHLDWETGRTRLDSVMSSKGREEASVWGWGFRHKVEAIMVEGRRYLVSVPLNLSGASPFQVVCTYDEKTKRLRLAAAVGDAGAFPYLQQPEFLKATGGRPLGEFTFIWADRNGDGLVQVEETVLTPKQGDVRVGHADAQLAFWSGAARYEVKEFLPDGTPVYELRPMPFVAHYHMPDGNHFRFGQRTGSGVNEVVDSQGRTLWFYRASHGMDGLNVPPWQPGRVDLQFGIAGFGRVTGDLGDIFVIAANNGQWNLWTSDGLLAGHLTLHQGDPRVKGWPAEHARGTRLENITAGQEHFHYFFTQTSDGKFYIVIGGMWASVVEVQGLERIRRGEAELTVTPEMLRRTREWEAQRHTRTLFTRAPVQECPPGTPLLDGRMNESEWPVLTHLDDYASFGMRYDDRHLFLGWTVKNRGPLENGGDDFRRYFKTGAAVDLQLGTRPAAAADRMTPAEGDIRILITRTGDKPVAVLYRPLAPDAPKADRWETSTPAGGSTAFDQVKILESAQLAVRSEAGSYVVEAAIPLAEIGLAPEPGQVLKMDWGVLTTDDGFVTRSRQYWANPMATGVADEPTEARLQPAVWGNLRFAAPRKEPGVTDFLQPRSSDPTLDRLLEELE